MGAALRGFWLGVLSFIPAVVYGAGATPGVESFSPEGVAKNVRQVKARFTEPIVAFGDLRRPAPFEAKCGEGGVGRWVDPELWVFDFKEDLPAGVGCEFKVRAGLKTLSGKPIAAHTYSFSTGGPAVLRTHPWEGSETVNEDQAFVLLLDAPVDGKSLEKVHFEIEGIPERVGVKVVDGSDRKVILKANYYLNDKIFDKLLVLQARQTFPSKAKVTLVWGTGVKSASGVPTTLARRFEFQARDKFRAEFSCERMQADGPCTPLSQMLLRFSASIDKSVLDKISLKGPNGYSRKAERWGEEGDYLDGVRFTPPFPDAATFRIEIPKGIKDDAGRLLSNEDKYPLEVKTGPYPPIAKFAGPFGIVETKAGGLLPLTVRSVEPELKAKLLRMGPASDRVKSEAYFGDIKGSAAKIGKDRMGDLRDWLSLSKRLGAETSIFKGNTDYLPPPSLPKPFVIPRKEDAKAFEVVGVPLKEPGFYVVEIESPKLGSALLAKEEPYHVPTTVLVTNLAVHFKHGKQSSIAWVTRLDDGKPVKGAQVKVWDCANHPLAQTATDGSGIARFGELSYDEDKLKCGKNKRGYSSYDYGLFVTAENGEEIAFVHTEWNDGIERWRFSLPGEMGDFPFAGHAVLDRSLFRAGETAHLKVFLRKQTEKGLEFPAEKDRRPEIRITHEGSGQDYFQKINWAPTATAEAAWPIPREAKLGSYRIDLIQRVKVKEGRNKKEVERIQSLSVGSFRVEEFRVPLLRASIHVPADVPVAPKKLSLTAGINYLSGGPASGLPVKMRTRFSGTWVSFPAYDDYQFANGDVKEERKRRSYYEDDEPAPKLFPDAKTKAVDLDKAGTVKVDVDDIPKLDVPFALHSELEFADPNGEIQTVSQTTKIYPSSVVLGVKKDFWNNSSKEVKLRIMAVDPRGRPIADTEVVVDAFLKKTLSHRKRILGGYYAYEHSSETKRVGELCRGKTDSHGRLICTGQAPAEGNLALRASAKDKQGRPSYANQDVWVAGKDDYWFQAMSNDRMDVIPEERRYEPGQTAKFQVRMPFREATALVTVEREGVIESFVKELSGKEPVVSVPIKLSYAPNVYVSVLAIRGRVGDVKPTGLIDLGRPAYKLGIAEVAVGIKPHELKVAVKADREVYAVRDKVNVSVKVAAASGVKLPADAEAIVAVVDEGLLELAPNRTWKLLEAMMGRRGYLVGTSTAQMHVVGKRHFGLKALPAGGGGGMEGGGSTRELFDTLVLWKARVKLSASGEARVEAPLNDSLTSFRIVAVASAGASQFGTGETSVRTSQDLMVLPGIPPLSRSGDKLRVGVQLRNTTEKKLSVQVKGNVSGDEKKSLPDQKVELGPQEAKEAYWEYQVPAMRGELKYTVTVSAGKTSDSVAVKQKVVDSVPVRAVQATVMQATGSVEVPVAMPAGGQAGRGGVQVKLSPSLVQGLDGVRAYMERYPYTCLEQQISRAVALRDRKLWDQAMAKLPGYLDGAGFAKYFPTSEEGSEVLSAYLVSLGAAAAWPLPASSETKLLTALEGFAEGRLARHSRLMTSDLTLRRVAALEALASNGKRVPKQAHLTAVEGDSSQWPTSGLIDWVRVLKKVEPQGDRLRKGLGQLRARVALQGTTLAFSTEKTDGLWWLMESGDVNAVRALHTLADDPAWVKDAPRMATGSLGRLRQGHWDLTTANAWGVLAVERFGQLYEKTPVKGSTEVALGSEKVSLQWKDKAPQTKQFRWPSGSSALLVKHAGTGTPWLSLLATAAIPLKEPLWAGYRIEKKSTAIERKIKDKWTRGDVVRIQIKISGQSPMTWAVVNDPIPAGSSVLGTGLGRDSAAATEKEKQEGWAAVAYDERSFEGFRRYFEYLPEGDYSFEYTVRLNNPGTFQLPPTRVEAMYAPEMFGELPNQTWEVGS